MSSGRTGTSPFGVDLHRALIDSLQADMPTKEFEAACEPIVLDILTRHEGLSSAEKEPTFTDTPRWTTSELAQAELSVWWRVVRRAPG